MVILANVAKRRYGLAGILILGPQDVYPHFLHCLDSVLPELRNFSLG